MKLAILLVASFISRHRLRKRRTKVTKRPKRGSKWFVRSQMRRAMLANAPATWSPH